MTNVQDEIDRAARVYTSSEQRELAIENLKVMGAIAPSICDQMRCRMLMLSLRRQQSFGGAA